MKKIIVLSLFAFSFASTSLFGQVADGITYQAVALDENGKEIAGHDINGNIIHSKQIDVRFSILSGTETGEVLYTEEHSTYTDQFGLFTLVIGHGNVLSGGTYQKLTDINWGADKLFLKVEIDVKRSGTFKIMGIQQMMAVPFAFHALTSSSTTVNYDDILNKPTFSTVATSGDYNDLLNRPTLFSGYYIDLLNKPVIPTKLSELTNDVGFITNPNDADSDPTNEIQTLSLEGNTLSISKGNSVSLASNSNDYAFRSLYFPQGIIHSIVSLHSTPVTDIVVPAGKTMYVLFGGWLNVVIDGIEYITISQRNLPTELSSPIFPSNTHLSYSNGLVYFLVDNDPGIEPVYFHVHSATNKTYTVPNGKKLIIKSMGCTDCSPVFGVFEYNLSNLTHYNLIIPPNTTISSFYPVTFTGYLIDDNQGGSPAETIVDVDGNVYSTVQIGTQTWMGENLRTTRLNDGTTGLGYIINNANWGSTTIAAYCWYDNDIANKNPYGALYNWLAVKSAKICPTGWHVPNDTEWELLRTLLGGMTLAGGPLKEEGTSNWASPNVGATNSSGFSGLPGGFRFNDGVFHSLHENALFWSTNEVNTSEAKYDDLIYSDTWFESGTTEKANGLSIRCVKD